MSATRPPRSSASRGSIEIFAAEALVVPVGLALVAFLSRRLGVEGYGEFVLVVAVVTWIEWGVAALFGRASLQLVAQAIDWRAPAATLVWLHGVTGFAAGALLLAGAPWVATALGAPAAVSGFRVLAADIPLFCLAQAHRQVAVAIGAYRVRAGVGAARSIARLALVVGLVHLGFSVTGALAAQVGASVVELLLCRAALRPGWWRDASFPVARVLLLAWPLFASAMAMRLLERLDLVMLQRLLGSPAQTALYGAAQQLAQLPLIVSAALVPVLSATLARLTSEGRREEAAHRLGLGIRAVVLMVPLAASAAGSGVDIARFVFGTPFAPAGALLGLLLVAVICYIGVYVATAAFIAVGRVGWCILLTCAMLVTAFAAHLAVVPRYGGTGAAWVSCLTSAMGAMAGTLAAARLFNLVLPWRPIVAPLALAFPCWIASATLPSQGWHVVVEMLALGAITMGALFASGAITRVEAKLLRPFGVGDL